jgi:hypothetical protein
VKQGIRRLQAMLQDNIELVSNLSIILLVAEKFEQCRTLLVKLGVCISAEDSFRGSTLMVAKV